MLNTSRRFRDRVLQSPSYLEWQYSVENGPNLYSSDLIKNLSITGQLQSQFTIGSSLSRSLELELLINEKTVISPTIIVKTTLVYRDYVQAEDGTLQEVIETESLIVGVFYVTDVDRTTYGKLKIKAIDMMGHTDYLSSYVKPFPITIENVGQVIDEIASEFALEVKMDEEYRNLVLTNFNAIPLDFSYRQLLEYMAGFCGCNVRVNNYLNDEETLISELEIFRFKNVNYNEFIEEDEYIVLDADNYYNITKGQYAFRPIKMVNENTFIQEEKSDDENNSEDNTRSSDISAKDNETIRFSNPYMTDADLLQISRDYCEGQIEYYPITTDIVGTCIFEPGDIVTIREAYRDIETGDIISFDDFELYIQDYKLTCSNGIKETLQSFFDYNKGSIGNSISNKITKLNTDLESTKAFFAENYVSNTQFEIKIEDLNTNVQYANDGLNKWIVEYYELTSLRNEDDYDLESILEIDYRRRELIEDNYKLTTGTLYDGINICRFRTGVYINPNNGLSTNCRFVTSVGANVYLNGEKIANQAEAPDYEKFPNTPEGVSRDYPISFNAGWNIVEIYVGCTNPADVQRGLETYFWLFYDNESLFPFYHITSTITQSEKEEDTYRTVMVMASDYEHTFSDILYEEKIKLGEKYNVSDIIPPKYKNCNLIRVTGGDLEGTVSKTVYIDATYLDENYILVSRSTLDENGNLIGTTNNSERLMQRSINAIYWLPKKYDSSIPDINGYTWSKNEAIVYKRTSEGVVEEILSTGLDEAIKIDETIIQISEKIYYAKDQPPKITVRYRDYDNGEVIVSEEEIIAYVGMEYELPKYYEGKRIIQSKIGNKTNLNTQLGEVVVNDDIIVDLYFIQPSRKLIILNISGSIDESPTETHIIDVISVGDTIRVSSPDLYSYIPEGYIRKDIYVYHNNEQCGIIDEEIVGGVDVVNVVDDVYATMICVLDDSNSSTFNLLPSVDTIEEDANEETNTDKIYRRFPFILLVNPYVIDVNYKSVTEVKRLTNPESIVDSITKTTIVDNNGNESQLVDQLFKNEKSEVVQTINSITQTISVHEKTLEETTEKMSEVVQTVDGFKFSFDTALYGNYLSNSAFGTDEPLSGFNYRKKYDVNGNTESITVFTYRTDTFENEELITSIANREDIESYGAITGLICPHCYLNYLDEYVVYPIKLKNSGGALTNEDENAYPSSNRTLSIGPNFRLSQTFNSDEEYFPFFKDNETGEYYQFYLSIKAKRTENCILEHFEDKKHIYPHMKMSIMINYLTELVIDEETHIINESITINNIDGQPSKDEGKDIYGFEVDLDNLSKLEDYEIDTEWKQIECFVNLPKDILDSALSIKSITAIFEVVYRPSVSKSYITKYINEGVVTEKFFSDIDEVTSIITEEDDIFICEPMFGTTKNYSALPFTTKKAELITGVTNITQDGIEISRSDSKLSTEIKNNGMAILYDGDMVAQFKQDAEVPVLNVTKKLTAPTIYLNSDEIPDTIEVSEEFNTDDSSFGKTVSVGHYDKIYPQYCHFSDLTVSLWQYGIIRKDKITIIIKANSNADGTTIVLPSGLGGFSGGAFLISDIKCGILEIIIEQGVELGAPIILKNIEGTVKIRGPLDKENYYSTYWDGITEEIDGVEVETQKPAPIVQHIIAHNVRWVEIWGLNFSGGHKYPSFNYNPADNGKLNYTYDSDKGGWINEGIESLKNNVYQTYGEAYTDEWQYHFIKLTDLYSNMKLEEVNDIINKVAIFIGYCWCGDVSRCNFSKIGGSLSYPDNNYHSIGIYGDHCDCYLFDNQGSTDKYYLNRNKCWFRLPLNADDFDISKPIEHDKNNITNGTPSKEKESSDLITGNGGNNNEGSNITVKYPAINSSTTKTSLMDNIFPAGMIRRKIDNIGKGVLDECFLGTSKDIVYLGSLLYDGAPANTYDANYFAPGSNLSGYSRISQNITLKNLENLYVNTDGYFFGSSTKLPSVSYSPASTSEAHYCDLGAENGTLNDRDTINGLRYTSLYNSLGFSIYMPGLKGQLDTKRRKLTKIKLELIFETENGKLVEYGNQSAFSNTTSSNIATYGGGTSGVLENKGIAFGVRFVYDNDAHHHNPYDQYITSRRLRMGYYNMGKCDRAHEILSNNKAINSWAINDNGSDSIHYINNFSRYFGGAEPFIVGINPFDVNDNELHKRVVIDLGVVDENWFSEEYRNSYEAEYQASDDDLVEPEYFFDTLKAFANDKISYIDIAPVGVWDCITDEFPNSNESGYTQFSFDITGDRESYIALATSCFKLTGANLILESEYVPEEPVKYNVTITYEDTHGNKIEGMNDVILEVDRGNFSIGNYKHSDSIPEGYYFKRTIYNGIETDYIDFYIQSDTTIKLVYCKGAELTVIYKTDTDIELNGGYSTIVEYEDTLVVAVSIKEFGGYTCTHINIIDANGTQKIPYEGFYKENGHYDFLPRLDTTVEVIYTYTSTILPDSPYNVEPTAWCVVSDTEVGNGSSFRLDSSINASGGFTNGKLFLGTLEKTNTNNSFDVWRTINGQYVSTSYTGGNVGTGISHYDFYTEGNVGTGIQLQFDWDKVFTALAGNLNGTIKLNLEFENKTYGTENTPIYFHIRLLFGELCSNSDKYHTMLDYSRTMIEFEKTGKDVYCLYGGDTDCWNRYKDSNPFNPSSSTCWSANAGSTFSIDIGSFTGLTSTTFKTSAQGTYTSELQLGSTWPVNPDHMANIRTAIRNKTLSAIQLIPIDRSYVYNNGYTPSRNCLRLTSASITIQ